MIGRSRKSYAARTLHRSVCYRRRVVGDGIITLRGSGFVLARRFPLREYWMVVDLFCSCDLYLNPTTFKYELDKYFWRYTGCANMNFFISKLSKVIV